MHKQSYYIINGITLYRLVAAPVLLLLIILNLPDAFKWLLAFSFFTDAIDGFLARRYGTTSRFGARLDSLADDLTIAVSIIAVIVFKPEFLKGEITLLITLGVLYIIQLVSAFIRYGKPSSFHTYAAKAAAILQAAFLLALFFFDEPVNVLFELMVIVTIVDICEEIILVWLLKEWQTDVRGIYWILKSRKHAG